MTAAVRRDSPRENDMEPRALPRRRRHETTQCQGCGRVGVRVFMRTPEGGGEPRRVLGEHKLPGREVRCWNGGAEAQPRRARRARSAA